MIERQPILGLLSADSPSHGVLFLSQDVLLLISLHSGPWFVLCIAGNQSSPSTQILV